MIQTELPIIQYEIEKSPIWQRANDGYVNATAMCKIAGKNFADYNRLSSTQDYFRALNSDMGIPISELIQVVKGGNPELQGTWVHPHVAIHLAQWLSPEFAVKVSKWVMEWMTGQAMKERLPDHVRRYLVNRPKIPNSHFSMLDQMTLRLLAPMEQHGYILPKNLMPDIALGKMFSKWLREQGYDPDSFEIYNHEFLDRRPTVPARLYPNQLLTEFNKQIEKWLISGQARRYFESRDQKSLTALNQVIRALPKPESEDTG